MSSFTATLDFEGNVARSIDCKAGEKVLGAAFRAKINLPMNCSDGVRGTYKCHAKSGTYDPGDDYTEDALTEDEKNTGLVLTRQMVPQSDCVIVVPTSPTACKTGQSTLGAMVSSIELCNDAAVMSELDMDATAPVFLPGQYANIGVSGGGQHHPHSFSSVSGETKISFLTKKIPGGATSIWLEVAKPGDKLDLQGPLGGFYLRDMQRPLLFLTDGTGLVPFLLMLGVLAHSNSQQPVHLIHGVTRNLSLIQVDAINAYVVRLPNFSYATVAADAASNHPCRDWVVQHIPASVLSDGDVDVYLYEPPPMADVVRKYFGNQGVKPESFHHEKFTPNAVPEVKVA